MQFAASILVFLFVGRWLDGKLGTEPWLLLTGVMVGAAAGFFSIYRQLVIAPRDRERRRKEEETR
jgi:F0F1-type ATP synthase assembly protein I